MFLCRPAKPVGRAFITHGSGLFEVPANRQRNVTWTLHKVHRLVTNKAVCLAAFKGHITPANLAKEEERVTYLNQKWDSPRGFISDCQHWDRIATIARSLSKSGQSQSGRGHIRTPQRGSVYGLHVTRSAVVDGNACFPGLSDRLFSTGTMRTRASSTAVATKQREAGEEQQPVSDKGDPSLKDPSPSPEQDPGKPEPEGGKPNKTQQLKKVFKEYGAVGVCFHIGISLMSLGMFYLLVSSGIDMAALLCKLGFNETVVKSKMAAGTSTFVLAYAIHKLFAPVRISITLVSVPLIVRHFRKIGLFRPPPAAP